MSIGKSIRSLRALEKRPANRALRIEALEARRLLGGDGLTGQYFHNADFTGLAAERSEAVDFNWGAGAPAAGVSPDSFSVRWIGQVEAQFNEVYTFRTVSDEGVRLWVDGRQVIDAWDAHAARVDTGTIMLVAGKRHDIRLEYFDNSGSARIRLEWFSASQPLEAIPPARLYASPPGLRAEFSDDAGAKASRYDAAVDFDWNAGSPVAGIAADNFRARWTGYVRPDFSEEYTFSTHSDDGVRLWVGDQLVIDNWTNEAPATKTGIKVLEAGKWYDIKVAYFNGMGDAEIDLQWSSARQTGAGQFEVVAGDHLRGAQPIVLKNPLGPGADPYVTQWQDSYLLVRSYLPGSSVRGVWIDKADQLQDVHYSNSASTTVLAWSAPPGTNYSQQIWAPELHRIDGKWYIYVAASDGDNSTHRMHVLERDDPDPMGPFTYKGKIAASTDRWAIDGTVLQWQDKEYFIWSGWPGSTDGQQNLYIAEMSNPWTISGNRVLLSSPTFAWERHGIAVNEGPQTLIHDGKLHIIYSGSAYFTHEYALGRLTYDGTGSLLDPASWTKSPTPVFQQAGAIVGTGHASFTTSPDGTQHWIVYHAHHDPNNWQDNRDVFMQPFSYSSDGTPNFGSPIPANIPLEAPTGEADADRPVVPADYDASGAVNSLDLSVFAQQFGQLTIPGISADGVADGMIDGADFLFWQRHVGVASTATSMVATADDAGALAAADDADGAMPPPLSAADGLSDGALKDGDVRRLDPPPPDRTLAAARTRKHGPPDNYGAQVSSAKSNPFDMALSYWTPLASDQRRMVSLELAEALTTVSLLQDDDIWEVLDQLVKKNLPRGNE